MPDFPLSQRQSKTDRTFVRVGNLELGRDFIVIAGPCAVESYEQTFACAEQVSRMGGHLLRGGAYKPRTNPYSFQGLGPEGVDILVRCARQHHLGVVSEVMDDENLRQMQDTVDVLQVGARNMQNFSLLKRLGKLRHPVLLKRGLAATVDEWLWAAEYILKEGNPNVILCERGIRTFESRMRNTLDLAAVVWAKQRTHLPVIVDPSHATGHRDLVTPLALASAVAGADGVMVEIHPTPLDALCDAAQALTFEQFSELMKKLTELLPHLGKSMA